MHGSSIHLACASFILCALAVLGVCRGCRRLDGNPGLRLVGNAFPQTAFANSIYLCVPPPPMTTTMPRAQHTHMCVGVRSLCSCTLVPTTARYPGLPTGDRQLVAAPMAPPCSRMCQFLPPTSTAPQQRVGASSVLSCTLFPMHGWGHMVPSSSPICSDVTGGGVHVILCQPACVGEQLFLLPGVPRLSPLHAVICPFL
jgi:hypothetical protein